MLPLSYSGITGQPGKLFRVVATTIHKVYGSNFTKEIKSLAIKWVGYSPRPFSPPSYTPL